MYIKKKKDTKDKKDKFFFTKNKILVLIRSKYFLFAHIRCFLVSSSHSYCLLYPQVLPEVHTLSQESTPSSSQ